MSKLKQNKIPMVLTEDNLLKIAVEQGVIENEFNWQLVRESDGLTKKSKDVMWIEFGDDGRFKAKHDVHGVGRSLIMSPFNDCYTWQTTSLTEVVGAEADLSYLKFKTANSCYTLTKINKQ